MLYRDDRPVFSTRVIVGQDVLRNQSPEFQATIDGVLFNPPWNIPQDIATDFNISVETVRSHLKNAYAKAGVTNRSAFVSLLTALLR